MKELIVVCCESASEVDKARLFWESDDLGFKLVANTPSDNFPKVRLYDFDPATPILIDRLDGRHVLMFVKA